MVIWSAGPRVRVKGAQSGSVPVLRSLEGSLSGSAAAGSGRQRGRKRMAYYPRPGRRMRIGRENSPLFQYLQDLGHTDFEACAPVSQEDDRAQDEGACSRDAPPPQKESWIRKLTGAMRRLSVVFSSNTTQQHERQLDEEFRRYALRCVLSQDVLLQEDIELIELLDPSILSLGSATSACPSVDTALPRPQLLAKPTVWDVSVLVCLVAVLAAMCACECFGLSPGVCVLCLSVCMVLRGFALRQRALQQKCVWEQCVCVERLVTESRTLTSVCRKTLRLVQETEVIYRGFTLVSAACPFNRAGTPRGQQLIGLRKAAYQSLRSAFRASRLATCLMLKSFPLSSEMDNVVNYVSSVPIKELGLGLGAEHLTDDQVQELTDDYSLPALKMLFQLWVGQSSEFFRRLALLMSPGRQEDSSLIMHQAITTVTSPLQHTLSGCLGDLQRSYDFHRYFEMQLQSQSERTHSHTRQRCHELNTLHASVRSLQLHLKTLLNEVIILEDELEKQMVAKETVAMTVAGYQELQERLSLLQPHMQASNGIWDDTLTQVDKMLRRATNCTGSPDGSEDSPPLVPQPPIRPVSLITDRDPVPEEQELEAYVSDSDSEPEYGLSSLSPWELERMRREGEESKRVLLELKSVLGFRASETERHKRQVLLFNEQAAVKPVAEETSEPNNQTDHSEPDVSMGNHVAVQQGEEGGREAKEERKDGEEKRGEEEKEEEKEEGRHQEVNEEANEFSCGVSASVADGDGEQENIKAQLFQYDGTPEAAGAESGDGLNPMAPRIPALTVMDRLTEIHGAQALSFSSAIAAQVAARSHTFTHMQEHTFGDSDEEEDEKEEEEEEEGEEEERTTERQRREENEDE
ncbi:vezatin isoform X2 [Clupea harengus]|uniref:Vezatin n=1 Tax=Clupea harengus TaxID=7950 RepID=A0A6P8GGR7_CLUHA|nr:vezatin isoform X2 [Clupea harengus]